jgi:predicted AAA+ superfamily ATPase
MELAQLKDILTLHRERFLGRTGLVGREAQGAIAPWLKQREIISIVGVRRSGKSSLLRLLAGDLMDKVAVPENRILYLNFEDERFTDFKPMDFEKILEAADEVLGSGGKRYFFLDEVQKVPGWERWLNRLYELEDAKIFVTGSNTELVGSKLSTSLTGRSRQVVNYPFSFREYLAFKGWKEAGKGGVLRREDRALARKRLSEYAKSGGFPEVVKIGDSSLLEQYFKDILYRDVIAGHSVRNQREVRELALYLASNPGAILSLDNMKKMIRVKSLNTVKNYLEMFESVFLFIRLNLFDYSVKRQIYNPPKFYPVDTGLSDAVGFHFSENKGKAFETMVFLDLKRRGLDAYYWKSKQGKEVDFVVRRGRKVEEAIQVSFDLRDSKTMEREIEGLRSAQKELGAKRLVVVTDDEEKEIKENGLHVEIVPLWKWLVNVDSIEK